MSYEIGKALKMKKSGKKISKSEKQLEKSTGLKKLNLDLIEMMKNDFLNLQKKQIMTLKQLRRKLN